MTDFTKILDKAKELESKMKESQEKIKNIQVEGISGSNSVKVRLNGDNEMIKINLKKELLDKTKNSGSYKKILGIFPDAELIDIKAIEDENKND